MKILIVGVTARALAESAIKSGYAVLALDAFGDLDLQQLCEGYALERDFHVPFSARGLARASRYLNFDAVVYTANFENYPAVLGQLGRTAYLLGNPPAVLERVRCPTTLFSILAKGGFRVPETLFPGSAQPPDPGRKWLVKPTRGGGGHRVRFRKAGEKPRRGEMLQEYLQGLACSASFVANGQSAVVLGLTEQLIGVREYGGWDFTYCGNRLPLATVAGPVLEQVERVATLLAREFGLVGVNGVDFILQNGLVCPVEVNPRYSASMELLECAYRLPIFDLHVRAIDAGHLPDFDLARRLRSPARAWMKVILYADKDGRAPDTRGWAARGIHDVPHPGERLVLRKPICTLLADAPTVEECSARIATEAARLKGEIYG